MKPGRPRRSVSEKDEKPERSKVSAHLDSMSLKATNQDRNPGVIINSDLNFSNHTNAITKSAYYHRQNTGRIKVFCLNKTQKNMFTHLSSVV